MTAMSLDAQQRRLVTGGDNGVLKAWNFSSGSCLKEMSSPCSKDVTGMQPRLLCLQAQIIALMPALITALITAQITAQHPRDTSTEAPRVRCDALDCHTGTRCGRALLLGPADASACGPAAPRCVAGTCTQCSRA